ncbi:hypothetical protein GALMADRAFT_253097 [Galerina marginata CBS 339.88]|uniref:DUF6534 domain-containing protein n=1 Tax=Galerina marginata (strain CBS 339.88) TaxID=685588 RepID=A0A067SX41_GALM3|nr:hypothetical protein GALMADRAFT_253097 [Galerina marginata CBS 339.88]
MLVTLGNTIGAVLLGTVGACILFGISTVQAYMYYTTYTKDWVFQKVIVGTLTALSAGHLLCLIHIVYYYTIEQFGNPAGLAKIVWSFRVQTIFNIIIIVIVHGLYIHRIWRLGSRYSRVWPGILVGLLGCATVIGVFLIYHAFRLHSFADIHEATWVLYAIFGTTTTMDFLIAASMCYYLNKSRSGFARTNNLVFTIMQYVLISGTLTSVTSSISIITFATMPHNLVFLGVSFLVTKLYINSYVAMLNARNHIRDESSISVDIRNLRSGLARPGDGTIVSRSDDKLLKRESAQHSSIYRGKDEGSSNSMGVHIHVHKTEELGGDNVGGSAWRAT